MDENLTLKSNSHVARVDVMETGTGKFRGIVDFQRIDQASDKKQPHQADSDRDDRRTALDDAIMVAHRLLRDFDR
nr:hypothetical protein [Burkholderia ambifaria]